uniref:Uncharacterized protein n=1 Tax=Arundo donax TaxID=35708 RepID=A0A0A9CDL2_ARUDO
MGTGSMENKSYAHIDVITR